MTPSLKSLNLNKHDRVVVAMSGGVDSSVAAALLHQLQLNVVGVTLQLHNPHNPNSITRSGSCCASSDVRDAQIAAKIIGFPHYTLNRENSFRKYVVQNFADSYAAGQTPVPCAQCNAHLKFRSLLNVAKDIGAKALATGHYAQISTKTPHTLLTAIDQSRDQSYFLFNTPRPALPFLRFPLGSMHKELVRSLAHKYNLPNARKTDSQDLCFIPNGKYHQLVAKIRPDVAKHGNIHDLHGNVLASHNGVHQFTVGQRRGLNLPQSSKKPLYVAHVNHITNSVVVAHKQHIATSHILLHNLNWLAPIPNLPQHVLVKIRSQSPPVPATLLQAKLPNQLLVSFKSPQHGVAPGQACVFHHHKNPQIILGGGWILQAPNPANAASISRPPPPPSTLDNANPPTTNAADTNNTHT